MPLIHGATMKKNILGFGILIQRPFYETLLLWSLRSIIKKIRHGQEADICLWRENFVTFVFLFCFIVFMKFVSVFGRQCDWGFTAPPFSHLGQARETTTSERNKVRRYMRTVMFVWYVNRSLCFWVTDHFLCRMLIPTPQLAHFDSIVTPFELKAYDILKSRSGEQRNVLKTIHLKIQFPVCVKEWHSKGSDRDSVLWFISSQCILLFSAPLALEPLDATLSHQSLVHQLAYCVFMHSYSLYLHCALCKCLSLFLFLPLSYSFF